MTLCTANFDLGTNGTEILTTDPGDATPWDVSTGSPSAGKPTYENIYSVNGTLSCRLRGAGDGTNTVQWRGTTSGTVTDYYNRVYVYFSGGIPASNMVFIAGKRTGGTGSAWGVHFYSSGYLRFSDQADSTIFISTNQLPTSQWVRLEWWVHHGDGSTDQDYIFKIFHNHNSPTPTETHSATSVGNYGFNANLDDGFDFGVNVLNYQSLYVDAIRMLDTSWPGPVGQLAYPDADSAIGNWTDQGGGTANLYTNIDEITASTADYIKSELTPSNSGSRYRLSDVTDPNSSIGHQLYWTAGKTVTGGDTINMTIKLYQGGGNSLGGGTLIASFARNNVAAFADYVETLSSGEADSITNYSDLYVEFFANKV